MCPENEAKKHGEYFMNSVENVHNKLIKWILPLKLCVCAGSECAAFEARQGVNLRNRE